MNNKNYLFMAFNKANNSVEAGRVALKDIGVLLQ